MGIVGETGEKGAKKRAKKSAKKAARKKVKSKSRLKPKCIENAQDKLDDLARQDAIKDMRREGIDVDPVTGEFRGGEGVIYEVPGSGTPSKKPYVGSTDNLDVRTRTATDARDRTQAVEIGHYPIGDRDARRRAGSY